MSTLWLTKLILSHLLTDFLFQKKSWIEDRKAKHFFSPYLYIHTLITSLFVLLFLGWEHWLVALVILITHTVIDVWKSYQTDTARFFVIDQGLHFIVIVICWFMTFYSFDEFKRDFAEINNNNGFWIILTGTFFLTFPCAILIGELTKRWRLSLDNQETLANAGRWIGIIERILILTLVLQDQYEAIGLLVAAKTIIRFNENNRAEEKTEYLLIGTLISIAIAMFTGMLVKYMTA